MSEFFKFSYEILSQIVYYLAAFAVAALRLFVTGWVDYFKIFLTYFPTLNIPGKILSVLLIAIPVLIILLIVRRAILHHQLKTDKSDNEALYREIGRLNKQVLDLMEEKNNILAIKAVVEEAPVVNNHRFPKLSLVDEKYLDFVRPPYNEEITLEQFAEGYRFYACSQLGLYDTPEIVRRFVAGMAASKMLILEGISGTGKTSLPYSSSAVIWTIRQPSFPYSRPIVTVRKSWVISMNFRRGLMRQSFCVHCMRQIIVPIRPSLCWMR